MNFKEHLDSSTLLILIMFCIGMYAVPIQLMHIDLTLIPGDLGDGRLNNYFLEHGYKWITGQVKNFWDAPFLYPAPRVMSFSEQHLGTMPIYSLFRLFHADRETSFQLWFLAIFTLNYFICAWSLKRLSVNALGAAAGAFVFAFSLPVIAQTGHTQLLPRFMIPLAFFFSFKYLKEPDSKTFAMLCLSIAAQMYCNIYMGFFLVLGISILFVSFVLFDHTRASLRVLMGNSLRGLMLNLGIILFACLLLIPLMLPYYQSSLEFGLRTWGEIVSMLPRFKSYFYPAHGSLLWSWLGSLGTNLALPWEHQLFIGAIPIAAFISFPLIFYRNRTEPLMKRGMIAFLALLLLIVLTLYMRPYLYRAILFIPGFKAIRAVSRIILMDAFFFSLILGIVLTKMSDYRLMVSRRYAGWLFTVAVLFAVSLDQFFHPLSGMAYSKADARHRSKSVEQLVLNKEPHAAVFAYMPDKSTDPPWFIHMDAMSAAQNLNMATVNGYTGNFPRGYFENFFEQYDRCDSYLIWKGLSTKKYGNPVNGTDLFQNVVIVGRDGCNENDRSFSVMSSTLPDDGYKANISFRTPRVTVSRRQKFDLSAQVTNVSFVTWGSLNEFGGKSGIFLSYRWLSADHAYLSGFDSRDPLPHDLHPGKSALFELSVIAPDKAGIYFLEFDLVHELITWFREKGSRTAQIEVEVL